MRIAFELSPLAVRIGIATGVVLAGDIMRGTRYEGSTVLGVTPNLAARLQGLSAPNGIVISGHTRRLLGRAFKCHSLGTMKLKGFADPVEAWRLQAEAHESAGQADRSRAKRESKKDHLAHVESWRDRFGISR